VAYVYYKRIRDAFRPNLSSQPEPRVVLDGEPALPFTGPLKRGALRIIFAVFPGLS